jgi:hypothetical protein
MKSKMLVLAALVAATAASNAQSALKCTEIMYTGLYGEFVEYTNTNANGGASFDLEDIEYSDNHNFATGYVVDLSNTGSPVLIAPGQSFIVTEAAEEIFDLAWYALPNGTTTVTRPATLVAVVGDVSVNLGRGDIAQIQDSLGGALDVLRFDDQLAPYNGPRTEDVSAVPDVAAGSAIALNDFRTWITSGAWKKGSAFSGATVAQPAGSVTPWKSGRATSVGTVGSPGVYNR